MVKKVLEPLKMAAEDDGTEGVSRRSLLTMLSGTSAAFAGLVMAADPDRVEALATEIANNPAIVAQSPVGLLELDPEGQVGRMQADLLKALEKPIEQRRWAMAIDLRKCVGCNGCTIACITENKLPPGVVYRPVVTETIGTYPNVAKRFLPRPCLHCEEPPCVPVCPVGATHKRPDGIVSIDYDECIGCRYCITACPYNARTFDYGAFYSGTDKPERYEEVPSPEYGIAWNRENEESPIGNARKCHFCVHRIEKGELPACTLSCMGRATFFGDLNDPESLISELHGQPNVMRLKEELGTKPTVFYLV